MKTRIILLYLFGLLLLTISTLAIFIINNFDYTKNNVTSGTLTYTCNCGWINWEHAIPKGVENLIKEVVYDTSLNSRTRSITYAQRMKINFILKSKIVVEVSRKYSIVGNVSKKEKEEIAYTIFQQTSESFEKLQGAFPFKLNNGSLRSSFRDGDLTGNKISFYRALRGYSKEYMQKICKPVSVNKSLALFNEGKLKLNKKWSPNYWMTKGIYPQELKEINPDTNLIAKKLVFINETKSIYLDF